VHLAIQAERASKHDRIAYDLPNALNRLGACGFQIWMVHSLHIVKNLVALFDVKKIQGHLALPVHWIKAKIGHSSLCTTRTTSPSYAQDFMSIRRSQCVSGHLPLFAERRFPGLVGLALGNLGNLGPHFEHDLFNAASDRKIAARRTSCRHRGHGRERDAHKFINQRIDICLPDKLAALLTRDHMPYTRPTRATCANCGRVFDINPIGRIPRHCRPSCRVRYCERRKHLRPTQLRKSYTSRFGACCRTRASSLATGRCR
jgi:hypothetical protein